MTAFVPVLHPFTVLATVWLRVGSWHFVLSETQVAPGQGLYSDYPSLPREYIRIRFQTRN